MNEEQFILGIYNYCDRWCERCPLTDRCRVYADEQEENAQYPESGNPKNKVFWERLGAKLDETMQLLQAVAADMNIDLEELPDELALDLESEADEPEFIQAAHSYGQQAGDWLKDKLPGVRDEFTYELELGLMASAERAEAIGRALEVVQWYLYQIEVKLRRAQHGLRSPWLEEEDIDEANGSAKVALIGTERSMAAWMVLYQHLDDYQDDVLQQLASLERIRQVTLRHFPDAPHFIRPGFDD
ncbi:MAG: hypothetical protein WA960_12640 [Tunicatimonas sp.]